MRHVAVGSRGVISGHARRLGLFGHLRLVLKHAAAGATAAAAAAAATAAAGAAAGAVATAAVSSLPCCCVAPALRGIGRNADIGGRRVSAIERGLRHADGIVGGGRRRGGRTGSFSFCDNRQGRFYGGTSG